MDGLSIRVAQGQGMSTQATQKSISSPIKGDVIGLQSPSSKAPDQSFAATLKDAVNTVNALQKTADQKMEALATGKAKSIPDVLIATEKADIAFKLMVQVRNKIIDAYQEVMKMQV